MMNLQSFPVLLDKTIWFLKISQIQIINFNNQEKIKVTTLRDYIIENKMKMVIYLQNSTSDELVIIGLYEFLEKKVIDYFILEYQNNDSFQNIKNILNTKDISLTIWSEMKMIR